ncbi:unnamed protein product [Lepeophtheirus salmonis]|uniref:(salmon louse) hypothetical protein n=1 Tax=Lepeophtheirus salmonis TaxID=72036 RepID=A0A7R8H571_LEPSM|nr:unnamed protein product [Lepeophtheirus salmonis]CAF2859256.1 unnamed protein product [Lepeophtheirus salmonis]
MQDKSACFYACCICESLLVSIELFKTHVPSHYKKVAEPTQSDSLAGLSVREDDKTSLVGEKEANLSLTWETLLYFREKIFSESDKLSDTKLRYLLLEEFHTVSDTMDAELVIPTVNLQFKTLDIVPQLGVLANIHKSFRLSSMPFIEAYEEAYGISSLTTALPQYN